MIHKVLGYVDEVSIPGAVQNFRTDFFKNRRYLKKTRTFLIQNKLQWYTYTILRGGTGCENMPKIPLFGTSLIHQLRLLGS